MKTIEEYKKENKELRKYNLELYIENKRLMGQIEELKSELLNNKKTTKMYQEELLKVSVEFTEYKKNHKE